MPFRPDIFADQGPVKDPGIYLIALRTHLNRGRTVLTDFVEETDELLPPPPGVRGADRGFEQRD